VLELAGNASKDLKVRPRQRAGGWVDMPAAPNA
jgi:hypothetical protein